MTPRPDAVPALPPGAPQREAGLDLHAIAGHPSTTPWLRLYPDVPPRARSAPRGAMTLALAPTLARHAEHAPTRPSSSLATTVRSSPRLSSSLCGVVYQPRDVHAEPIHRSACAPRRARRRRERTTDSRDAWEPRAVEERVARHHRRERLRDGDTSRHELRRLLQPPGASSRMSECRTVSRTDA